MEPIAGDDGMGINIVVTRNLFEPLPDDANSFGLRDSAVRVLAQQPEATLASGIDAISDTVFNRHQMTRLLQEFRAFARQSDETTRQNLEDAASFIERETSAMGHGAECYVSFLGD